ncbi:MAG: hypothetical protein AUI50_05580 [Crenarchaeota archaeon 13_1_40CM_2_52_14]|nr:MAG: hypothetical protein AUI50_05580 [Crenarchaeota archaeon 13_1_40CM_2_52_14]
MAGQLSSFWTLWEFCSVGLGSKGTLFVPSPPSALVRTSLGVFQDPELITAPMSKGREVIVQIYSEKMRRTVDILGSVFEIELCILGNRDIAKDESVRAGILELIWGMVLSASSRFWQFRGEIPVGGHCVV